MEETKLIDEYFQWIYKMMEGFFGPDKKYSYLFEDLFVITFTYTIPNDENREMDGLNLRRHFAYAVGYNPDEVCDILRHKPCSVLEMITALAIKIYNTMDDSSDDKPVKYWFWAMLFNLGLSTMSNDIYIGGYVHNRVNRFLNRQYNYVSGRGSLFPNVLRDPLYAEKEIWDQKNGWLRQFI